jgi:hypothetical protein
MRGRHDSQDLGASTFNRLTGVPDYRLTIDKEVIFRGTR